jgi:DNA (cytosine-5)-methyltransferase 1
MKSRTLIVDLLYSILQKILKLIIMSKKELISLIAILLVGSLFIGCSKFESKDEERVIFVKTTTVSPSNIIVGNSYVGLVEEELSTSLSFQSIGNIENIYVGEGQRVSKGQLLATLNKAKEAFPDNYGRLAWDKLSSTITTKFNQYYSGRFGHPEQDRALSLREGALIQTFPKDYQFFGTDYQIARQIGNAVPVNLSKAVGETFIYAIV